MNKEKDAGAIEWFVTILVFVFATTSLFTFKGCYEGSAARDHEVKMRELSIEEIKALAVRAWTIESNTIHQ